MQKKWLYALVVMVLLPTAVSAAIENQKAQAFIGQDLHLRGGKLISYQLNTGEHTLVFRNGFSMSIGVNQFSSDKAVVWLESVTTEFRGRTRVDYKVKIYLKNKISIKKTEGVKTVDLIQTVIIKEDKSAVVQFDVSGEVFVTADEREISDPRKLELYTEALAAVVPAELKFVVRPEAVVPELPEERKPPEKARKKVVVKEKPPVKVKERVAAKPSKTIPTPTEPEKEAAAVKRKKPGFFESIFGPKKREAKPTKAVTKKQVKRPQFRYPVNISPIGEKPLKLDSAPAPDGTEIATLRQRFYLWQKQDEQGSLLELQADNAVIFYSTKQLEEDEEQAESKEVLAKAPVQAIYMSGDVVMTEGQRTIRADELYYDFQRQKALAINATMKNFDISRGIPIYIRAAKIRQVARNQFAAKNITMTTSEFYLPQISLTASDMIITDTIAVDQREGKASDSSYDAQLRNVRLKMGKRTIFYWPFIRSNLKKPDTPLKSIHAGYDNRWGTSFETRWYLARLLGLQEPEGTDSTLELDYYSKRGVGTGVKIDYKRENYYGRILGYVIKDTGEDRLGRHDSRKDLEPPNELRGRFQWVHRQFLPHNWQLTSGISYSSDENFIEEYYRQEFSTGLEQETYIHLKRSEDNWALSFLSKARINNFADELEELPSIEYHLTGQSLFNDKYTLYSDTQLSRMRQRIGNKHLGIAMDENQFSFASHRTELDMPIWIGPFKTVPFVAGTFGYDDRSGFTRTLVDGTKTGKFGEDKVLIGEIGVRLSPRPYWKVYPDVKSRLWDLNQLRHIIKPQLIAALYEETNSAVEQHDTLNIGVSQRLQTKRGRGDRQRTVDWMRLDMDVTWVSNSDSGGSVGPDRFIWNKPIVPLRVLSAPDIFNGDLIPELHRFEMYGPRRNYFGADYIWRISDTSAILSDMNYDMQTGVVQQFNIGYSHLRWPNLSYYIGSRYLRRVEVLDESGSNMFTFAATYVLDPRYTIVFAQQFDLDYGANVRSDITLIRKYHRMYYGLTLSADQTEDRQTIVFSIWPQGVPEMSIGPRRYMELGGSAGY